MYQYLTKHAKGPFFGPDAPEFEGRFNAEGLLDALNVVLDEVDMNRFAAVEASNATEAYYDVRLSLFHLRTILTQRQVTLKNVNDDIAMHAIEARLLKLLSGIFTHQHVMRLDNKSITLLAGESEESMQDREATKKKLAVLRETKTILHRLDRHKPSGR